MREDAAARLKASREAKNLRRDAVADRAKMGHGTLSGWENEVPQAFEWLRALSEMYDVPVDHILGIKRMPSQPAILELGALIEGVSDAALDDIKNVVRLLAESDRQRQQMARENRFFLDVIEGAGSEAVDALVDTLRATRDPVLRRERLTTWLDANFPLGNLTSEP